jgi:hypothetical protein
MNDINDIRRANARELATKLCGNLASFADKIDRAPTQVSRFMGKNPNKPIGTKLARHIEQCFNKESGWLDQDRSSPDYQQTKTKQTNQTQEESALYMALKPETNQLELLHSVIKTIEQILEEEQITLTPEEKAQAIIACLQTCIKRGISNATDNAVAITAIHAVI